MDVADYRNNWEVAETYSDTPCRVAINTGCCDWLRSSEVQHPCLMRSDRPVWVSNQKVL
ncbi:hypothetical protein GCM10012289_77790 [Nonomuraea cavernae]|uniref:Uncharacterized protein n=1 Tax=Nonomuraea cavernae TaxID=2045107 RepID=A0A917ZKD3_9ACTN|nr:hypothetical protein GCM10012289_77790 [Nonomuraea cavernae]